MQPPERSDAQTAAPVEITEKPATVLVADDDPILREFALMELSDDTVTVESAFDGLNAWEMLGERSFDLLLVDLDMPRMNGFELIDKIRSDPRLRLLPVVVVTGREDVAAIDRAYEAGATSFVTKPLNWRLLKYQLRYVLRMSQVEMEIRDARDRAEEASQLRGNILKMMRHEVHTPMNAILGFSKLLGERAPTPPGPEATREYAHHIAEAGERLYATLSDIMRFAEMLSGDVPLYEDDYLPRKLLDSACQFVAGAVAEIGTRVAIDDRTGGVRLACDRAQVERALGNLLDNAIRFSGAGGEVSVVAHVNEAGRLAFVIADNGPGIDAEQMTHCFEPFQQGDSPLARAKEGLGLGLPIAKRIADLHGAELTLDSTPGAGTTVRLVFPPQRTVID